MADEDDPHQNTFQPTQDAATTALDIVTATAELAVAVAGGTLVRAHEIIALADHAGDFSLPVASQCIASLGYNVRTGDMTVTFQDGSEYSYPSVHMVDFIRFINAPSKGSYYNLKFRGKEEYIQGKKKGSHIKP